MAGPPMSMFSTMSSNGAPRATVSRKGYRFTTARSIGESPPFCISSRCFAVARPSRPPWMRGCNVLTRPSRISGAPVKSLTSRTGTPDAASAFAVPPLASSSSPLFARLLPNSARPVLSETENSARVNFATALSSRSFRAGSTPFQRHGIPDRSGREDRPKAVPRRCSALGLEFRRRTLRSARADHGRHRSVRSPRGRALGHLIRSAPRVPATGPHRTIRTAPEPPVRLASPRSRMPTASSPIHSRARPTTRAWSIAKPGATARTGPSIRGASRGTCRRTDGRSRDPPPSETCCRACPGGSPT